MNAEFLSPMETGVHGVHNPLVAQASSKSLTFTFTTAVNLPNMSVRAAETCAAVMFR